MNRTYWDNTSTGARVANVYYSVNSMVTAIVNWSTRIDSLFTGNNGGKPKIFLVKHSPAITSTGWSEKGLGVAWDDYFEGFKIRHEMGHSIHSAMHEGNFKMKLPSDSCVNSNHLNHSGHNGLSCEWGSKAMKEGMASFIAVRSATMNDTEVWSCSCNEGRGGQQVCSQLAAGLLSDADRYHTSCIEGSIRGVGDKYADSTSTCAYVTQNLGCGCNSNPCEESFRVFEGWQNTTQVMRFFWDMIDANNEYGWDDTDENMTSFVGIIESMPCTGSDWGEDGSCNEPNVKSGRDWACVPSNPMGSYPPPHFATRHSYNVWDVASRIPGSQTHERILNCVHGATD